MRKRIIITESQLMEIIGSGDYLNQNDNTNSFRLGSSEVGVDGTIGNYVDGDEEGGDPVTTDDVAASMCQKQHGFKKYITCSQNITEANHELTGKQARITVPQQVRQKVQNTIQTYKGDKNEPGFKRFKRIADEGTINYENAEEILTQAANGDAGVKQFDPNGEVQQALKNGTARYKSMTQSTRNNKISRGEGVRNNTTANANPFGTSHNSNSNAISSVYGKMN